MRLTNERKAMKNPLELPIVDSNAAGVDVGSEKFFASIGGKEPRVFLTVTEQMKGAVPTFQSRESKQRGDGGHGSLLDLYWFSVKRRMA